MRHLKADVSHRMRRRPSIFSTRWFRLVLGVGALAVVALAIGPSVVNGLRARPAARIAVPSPGPIGPVLKRPQAPPAPQVDGERPEPTAAVRPARPEAPAPPAPASNGPAVTTGPSPVRTGVAAATPTPAPVPTPAPTPPAPSAAKPKPTPEGADSVGTGVFRVQVGAFLDHRNADRLVARLRSENFEVVDSVMEQSRVLYRVLATPRPGEGYDSLVAEIKRYGFAPEMKGDSAVVTGPIPLREAVEASRALKDHGLLIRLERQMSSGSFRVVRVGDFTTAAEAERVRADLAARGLEGIVVREK